MRLRLRHPAGQVPVFLPDDATVSDLFNEIKRISGLERFQVQAGYPPQTLNFSTVAESIPLADTAFDLDGQQLTISALETKPTQNHLQPNDTSFKNPLKHPPAEAVKPKGASGSLDSADQDAPEVSMPSRGGVLLLRVMPDDNSCLFRAFNSAFFGLMDNVHELRSIIAQSIQAQPDVYTTVVLEQSPDDYGRWITTENAWGGAIELDILSKFFDIEIISIDVQTLRIDKYNEGKRRCILVYSGIHYDLIALSPSSNCAPDLDTKIFDTHDDAILQGALELCQVLQKKHYYTDTSGFHLKCQDCGKSLKGERAALQHAKATGHSNFGEAN